MRRKRQKPLLMIWDGVIIDVDDDDDVHLLR